MQVDEIEQELSRMERICELHITQGVLDCFVIVVSIDGLLD